MNIKDLVGGFKRVLGLIPGYQRNLEVIRRNLSQINESERREYAQRVYDRLIAVLHDMSEADDTRRMRNLRIAAALQDEYQFRGSSYVRGRLRQFRANSAYRSMPVEGFVLTKFLFVGSVFPRINLVDFLRSESAKAKLDYYEYSAGLDELLDSSAVSVPRERGEDNGFDPFNPDTWKK